MPHPAPAIRRLSTVHARAGALADLDGILAPWLVPKSASPSVGTLRLFAAVLERGIEDLLTRTGRREARDAEAWIFTSDEAAVLPFATVCAALDIDAEALRARLRPFTETAPS